MSEKDNEIYNISVVVDNPHDDKPHNGGPITMLEVSPNGKYLVTYSDNDHSIVEWDAKITEEQLKPGITVEVDREYELNKICISDDKELACIYIYDGRNYLKIIDMNNPDDQIEPYFNKGLYPYDCTFKTVTQDNLISSREFILCGNIYDEDTIKKNINDKENDHYIWVYSTKNAITSGEGAKDKKCKKWTCENLYKIPRDFEVINISKDAKLYLLLNNYIYEWNILTGNMIRSIFLNEKGRKMKEGDKENKEENKKGKENGRNEKGEKDKENEEDEEDEEEDEKDEKDEFDEENEEDEEDKHIEGITSNDKFICLRIKGTKDKKTKDKVTIYSIVLGISIASLDINDDNQLYQLHNLINHPGLYPLLPSLSSLFGDICWKKCLEKKKLTVEDQAESLPIVHTTTNYVFGILEGHVRKLKFEKEFIPDFGSNTINKKDKNIVESWDIYFGSDSGISETYDHLNINVFTDMDPILNQDLINFIRNTMMSYNDVFMKRMGETVLKASIKSDGIELLKDDKVNTKISDVKQEFIYIKIVNEENTKMDMVVNEKSIKVDGNEKNTKVDRMILAPRNIMNNMHEIVNVIKDIKYKNECKVKEFIYIKKIADGTTNVIENQNIVKVKIINNEKEKKFKLGVYKFNGNRWTLISKKFEELNYCECEVSILGIKLFYNNDIAILTTIGLFIYYFNENSKSISLNYFHSLNKNHMVQYYKKVIKSTFTLPAPDHNSFKFDSWVSYLNGKKDSSEDNKGNKESFLKYGVELLTFAIKEHKLELVKEIYEKCIEYFQEDINNKEFLSIITTAIPLLEEYYPDFVSKYLSATNMITDSPFYNVEYQSTDSHLHAFFQKSQILTQSILWTKFNYQFYNYNNYDKPIMKAIQLLLLPLTLPLFIFFIISSKLHILPNLHFINNIYKCNLFSMFYYYIDDNVSFKSKHKLIPTITFMVPYIKFVNYSEDYNWFLDWIKPQPSPFIKTMHNKKIYRTWNGEALINFKWKNYGRYYYYAIWIGFLALLVCFTIAATVPQIDKNTRKNLLIASIILGFIHINFEVHQLICDPIKWAKDSWNYIDAIVYVLPTITSIYWLTQDLNIRSEPIASLLSYSCLFLDLKLLLFFRVYRSYGRYFAITISVAKKVYIFLIVFLTIIMMSFAHAFHILLSPKSSYDFEDHSTIDKNDPNNPWTLAPTYQIFYKDNDTGANLYAIQEPDENTNMFAYYNTSLFTMVSFLTGDLSALSNWKYIKNPTVVLLVVFFVFLTVIYLINVFIGLFTEVIQDENLEASQLILKVEMLAEIELFYLLPHQRRWKAWFPDVIYYHADVDKTRTKVQEMIQNDEWNDEVFPNMREALLKRLNLK